MDTQDTFYNTDDVIRITGTSRPTIWRWRKLGKFPKGINIGDNTIRWLKSDIDEWMASFKS